MQSHLLSNNETLNWEIEEIWEIKGQPLAFSLSLIHEIINL
jgi:hypothetical protein